jgi:hypothetical protein
LEALIAFYFYIKENNLEFVVSHKVASEVLGLLGLALICYSIFAFDKATSIPKFICSHTNYWYSINNHILITYYCRWPFAWDKAPCWPWFNKLQHLFVAPCTFCFCSAQESYRTGCRFASHPVRFFICASFFSWRFVETPFRDRKATSRKQVFCFAVIGSVFFASIGLLGYLKKGFPERFNIDQSIKDSLEWHSLCRVCEIGYIYDGKNIINCSVGSDAKDAEKIALVGDSHSCRLLKTFDIVGKQKNYSVIYIGLSGCLPLIGVDIARPDYEPGVCENISSLGLEYVKKNNIKQTASVASQPVMRRTISLFFTATSKGQRIGREMYPSYIQMTFNGSDIVVRGLDPFLEIISLKTGEMNSLTSLKYVDYLVQAPDGKSVLGLSYAHGIFFSLDPATQDVKTLYLDLYRETIPRVYFSLIAFQPTLINIYGDRAYFLDPVNKRLLGVNYTSMTKEVDVPLEDQYYGLDISPSGSMAVAYWGSLYKKGSSFTTTVAVISFSPLTISYYSVPALKEGWSSLYYGSTYGAIATAVILPESGKATPIAGSHPQDPARRRRCQHRSGRRPGDARIRQPGSPQRSPDSGDQPHQRL